MWSGKKYSIVMAVLMICVMSVPAAAQLADTPWPMFHHDLNHTGLSTGYGPDTSFVNWTFSTGARISGSAVIGEDGTIYIGTRNYQKPMTGSKLYAIYPNGTEKWHWTASHFIDSTPAVASDGTVYMGSWDRCLYALYPNGTKKWELCTPCGGFVLSSPAIAPDGTIYIGSHNSKLYAIHPNGTLKWNYPTGCSIHSSPAIGSDGVIYVGSCDKKLYAIYPNGTLKWSYRTGCCIRSSPAIGADGTIYVGSHDKKLYAIYPNGTKKWSYNTGGWIVSSPAIDADGTIYVGSNDKKLYAIYPNGTKKWLYTTGGRIKSSPAIDADGTIYMGSYDEYVYAVNPNGTLLWKHYTGNSILHSSPAIAADGTVYIGNWGGNLYAFGPGTQPPGTSNRPPILDAIGDKTINETETVTIDLNATDPDGDSLTYSCNKTNLFSDFDPVTGTGNWTTGYTDSGTYWVDFGVSDGNGGTDNETIQITVLDVNEAPVLDPVGNKVISETETVTIDLNATDPDGDSLTYSCNKTNLFTDFDSSTGTGSWTTVYSDSGTYWVNFGVSDGNGGIDNETIQITVLDVNEAPVLDPVGNKVISETETVTIDLNASDPDGDTLTYSCNRTDLFTDFDSSTGTGSWTTVYSDSGTYWVNFGVSDGNGGIDNETIRITVLDVNEAPVLDAIGDKAINEAETVAIDLNASDPDGDTLTYSCNRTDLFTDFDSSTGTGSWTTVYSDSGTYWVNFGVSDGNGGIDNETIRITVLDVNEAPVLDPVGNKVISETETVTIDLNASDPDGDTLTYSCNRTNLFTDFDSSTGTGSWTTVYSDSGTYWVNFGVSDGNGGIDNETIRITVLDVNEAPVLDSIGDKTINEAETVAIDLNATDPNGDTLTYSCNRTDLFTDFDSSTGTGSWITGYGDSGIYWVNFGVSDGNGGIDNETIRITVLDVNEAPVLDPVGNKVISETETVTIDLNASDPDGDTLTYSCNRTNLFTDFDSSTGTGSWTTVYSDSGTYWVNFGVSDGNGGIDNETIRITVLDVNEAPVLDSIGDKTINEAETVAIDLNATDPNGDTLTYSCNRTDLFTDFDSSTGTGSWITGYGDSGIYWVNFGVSDGNGGTDNETIQITVLDVNEAPVLDSIGDKAINETETVAIDLDATDPDGDSLTYSCNRTGMFSDFDPVTGTGNWTTGYTDSGTYWVNFGVSDGNGGTDNETIQITVSDANRQPVLDAIGSSECRKIGEQFDILINIIPIGIPLMGAQFDLQFNASALKAETVMYGNFLTQDGWSSIHTPYSDIDNVNGVVKFAAARQGTSEGVTESGTFAIVHFTAETQGMTSELNLTNALASDNATPVNTYELVTHNGTVEVCLNTPPAAVAKSSFTYNNIAEKGLSKAYFDGTDSYDPNGTITNYRWWIDDGSSLAGEIAEHLFLVPIYWQGGSGGYYVDASVTLTVTDDGMPLMDGSDSMDVIVWIAGDATSDGRVNIADGVTFGMQFGKQANIGPDGLRWYDNPEGDKADLNNDGRVNIGDAMLLGTSWGHTAW